MFALRPFALIALFLAGPTSAQTDHPSYKGITLGAPIPALYMPRRSELWADRLNADMLPAHMLHLCEHDLLPMGGGRIILTTDTCAGPVLRISATEPLIVFYDPDAVLPPVTTDIAGMEFKVTTLSEARARFGSEGLDAGRWFGKAAPDNIGAFAFIYEIASTGTVAAFWFQMPRASGWQLNAPDGLETLQRDDALLIAIDLMSAEMFDLLTVDAPSRANDTYTPLPNLFEN